MTESREKKARRIIRRSAVSAAVTEIAPVPLWGVIGVPALQARMLVEMGETFVQSLQPKEAKDLVGLLGGATAFRYLCRRFALLACRAFPPVGMVAGPASAFGSTFALGQVALRYFRSCQKRDPDHEDFDVIPGSPDFEREARALQLEWESGAITEKTYYRDLVDLEDQLKKHREVSAE